MPSNKTDTALPPMNVSTRRKFLQRSGTLAAGLTIAAGTPRHSPASNTEQGQEGMVRLGIIGCGRRGRQLIDAAARVPEVAITMVCDVDARRSVAAADLVADRTGRRPANTGDHRDLLDSPDLHAVVIATPDHWHTSILLSACAAEKDAYVESPLGLYMTEAKAAVYATRKYKRVVQVGLQLRSSGRFAEASRIVRSGNLGRISQTRTWTFARRQPIAAQPDGDAPAPLDYDRWLGPAGQRPYNPVRFGYPQHFWDYGSGEAGLWNIHLQDWMHACMRVTVPKSVVAVGGNYGLVDARETPDTLDAIFEYTSPVGHFMQTYSLRLNNAYAGWGPAALPAAEETTGNLPARSGVQFFGSDRTLYVGSRRLLLLPAGEESPLEDLRFMNMGEEADAQPTSQPADQADDLTAAHFQEFVNCVRARTQPSASVEAAQWAMLPNVAANISYRVGRKLYIKPDTGEFFKDPQLEQPDAEANALSYRPYREEYPPPEV